MAEKRRYRRVERDIQGSFTADGNHHYPLRILNISEGGLLFIAPHYIPPLTNLEVTLEIKPKILKIGAVVVHIEGLERFTGGLFFNKISEDDRLNLRRFLDEK